MISEINPFIGQIRIVGGKYPSEGLVEVHCNGEWGTICDDAFGKDEADTVCIQMGYTDAVQYDHLASMWVSIKIYIIYMYMIPYHFD